MTQPPPGRPPDVGAHGRAAAGGGRGPTPGRDPRGADPGRGSRLARAAPLATALLVTLLFALWRGVVGDPWTDALDRWTLDLRFQFRGPWPVADQVAVVAIEEETLARHPNPPALRAAIAEAVPGILAQDPASLALDLLLVDATASDGALAAALAGDPRVLLAVAALDIPPQAPPAPAVEDALARSAFAVVIDPGAAPPPEAGLLLAPAPGLVGVGRLGHVNLLRGPDRAARVAPLSLSAPGGRALPSMALASAALASGRPLSLVRGREARLGDLAIPLLAGDRVIIDHPGPPSAIPTWSLDDLRAGAVPAGAFRGRMVFLGAMAESLQDSFATPFAVEAPGVTIIAGLAAGLAEGRVLRRDATTGIASAALALATCLLAFAAYARRTGAFAPAFAAVAGLAAAAAAQAAFGAGGWWLDGPAPALGFAAGWLGGAAARRLQAGRERANLAGYVPPALAEMIARGGAGGFVGRMQDAAAIFADVEGYTSLAERMTPLATAEFLAALHAAIEDRASAHGGVVVDWQGDGAMIAFGLPEPAPDDAARALACAVALARSVPESLAARAPAGAAPRLRVSIHHGPAAAARLGGARQAVLTLTGDTVNLAARLQEIARRHRLRLVASREALDAAGDVPAARGWHFLELAAIRGREAPAEVWTLPDDA